ncbi:MAG TPA: cobalamin biosynthesis protein [Polyangia bacterium]|nr:cobalamin biosynthesis protein [Polyangia bacterium]
MSAPVSRKPFAIYAITRHGIGIARRLLDGRLPGADLYVSEKLAAQAPPEARALALPMGPTLAETWLGYDCHVFIISVGAVVRMVAPLLKNKKVDPAVLCIDDAARFTICVLSGHVGRGNAFTERVAGALGNQAVITTASDAIGTLTVDILGRELGWTLDDPDRNVTAGCAAVVNAAPVMFVQEAGEPHFWPLDQALPPGVAYTTALDGVDPEAFELLLICSDRDVQASHPRHFQRAVVYRPRTLVLGIGCDRDTPSALMERGVDHLLARHGLSPKAVAAVATIDKKKDETAILALCARRAWMLRTFEAAALDAAPGIENPSATVQRHVGTRGVAEPAALLAAGAPSLLVPKQIYTEDGAGRSMTLAVARIPFPPRAAAAVTGGVA